MAIARRFTLLICLAGLVVATVAPAASAGEVPEGLHTGLYSDDFDSSGDLNGGGASAGQKVTFGGTFHNVNENDAVQTPTWSNTREILEGVWKAKATPFAHATA